MYFYFVTEDVYNGDGVNVESVMCEKKPLDEEAANLLGQKFLPNSTKLGRKVYIYMSKLVYIEYIESIYNS